MKPGLGKGVQVWLDDVLGYAESDSTLLKTLEVVLGQCHKYGVKLNPAKCTFLTYSTIWCGKQISKGGISHCASRVQGLCELEIPETAAELQKFLCAVNWMRNSIPNYTALVHDLHEILEIATKAAGSRKKRNLLQICLKDHDWTTKQDECLEK